MAGTHNPTGYVASTREMDLDDAPRYLNDAGKLVWLNAYESAERAYGDLRWAKPHDVADYVASGWRNMPAAGKGKVELPWQGATTYLGTMLEVHYALTEGQVFVQSFGRSPPALLWSASQKEDRAGGSVYAYPGLKIPTPSLNAYEAPKAARVYTQWRDGNERPRGASEVDFPVPNVSAAKPAIAVVYRSDKFSPGKKIDYIHHFDKGVRVRLGPGKIPNAVYITGGRLRLTERGLER